MNFTNNWAVLLITDYNDSVVICDDEWELRKFLKDHCIDEILSPKESDNIYEMIQDIIDYEEDYYYQGPKIVAVDKLQINENYNWKVVCTYLNKKYCIKMYETDNELLEFLKKEIVQNDFSDIIPDELKIVDLVDKVMDSIDDKLDSDDILSEKFRHLTIYKIKP